MPFIKEILMPGQTSGNIILMLLFLLRQAPVIFQVRVGTAWLQERKEILRIAENPQERRWTVLIFRPMEIWLGLNINKFILLLPLTICFLLKKIGVTG